MDKHDLEYFAQRLKNNLAVQKTREKKRREQRAVDKRIQQLLVSGVLSA